jgi:hypothetical protein
MVLTVLEANVPVGREGELEAAYHEGATGSLPAAFIRSELLRDARDQTRWRIQTWWLSVDALDAMRRAGTPRGVLMFRAAGAEPALSVFDVVDALPHD